MKPRAVTVRELDALARKAVFERDGHACARCGATERLQWCHVYSRRYHSMRWEMDNSFVGCAGCHLRWHHRPLEAVEWYRGKYPERFARLLLRAGTPSKVDREAVKLYLTGGAR